MNEGKGSEERNETEKSSGAKEKDCNIKTKSTGKIGFSGKMREKKAYNIILHHVISSPISIDSLPLTLIHSLLLFNHNSSHHGFCWESIHSYGEHSLALSQSIHGGGRDGCHRG